jgi:DnaJ-class molecular chaperone
MKAYPNCSWCKGSGVLASRAHIGFFEYEAGARCPECGMREQREIAREAESMRGSIAPSADESILARLRRLEEAVFGDKGI